MTMKVSDQVEVFLGAEDFEEAIKPIFASSSFSESDFDRIANLLARRGRVEWSYRPRHYAVLRMIDRLDLMFDLVSDGVKDIALPYPSSRMPQVLNTASVRLHFLEKQDLVLTDAKNFEIAGGRHQHLDHDGDIYFDILRELGFGKFGTVHRVRSKLSRQEYAVCETVELYFPALRFQFKS